MLRTHIEWLFTGLTTYGGGVGEVMGVSIFMAASLGTLSAGALMRGSMPAWVAGLGLVSALLLAGLALPVLRGPQVVPVAIAVSVLSLSMLVAGFWVVLTRHSTRA